MEGNKDESERCVNIAEKFINAGERDKALKYLKKAERLYPSQKAKGNHICITAVNDFICWNFVLLRWWVWIVDYGCYNSAVEKSLIMRIVCTLDDSDFRNH